MSSGFKQQGQILALALIVVGLVLLNTLVIISGSLTFFQNATYSVGAAEALNLAEAGIDKALTSLNVTAGSYSGEDETPLGAGSYSVSVTTVDPNTKTVTATGYIPSKASAKVKRTVKINISRGVGVAFNYGIQAGNGGVNIGQNSTINGSVYSNGNVVEANNSSISGDVFVAGGVQPVPDQQTDCTGINCTDFIFGKNVSGNNIYDVAQSFTAEDSGVLRKVSLKVKKSGSTADLPVKILADSGNSPDKTNVLASGTLSASLVSASTYGFVDVLFTTPPSLVSGTKYWLLVDTSTDPNGYYWYWQLDSASSYTAGFPVWTADWTAKNATWRAVNGDLSFKTYLGGVPTSISGSGSAVVGGNTHANTISGMTITKAAYYQILTNSTAAQYFPNSTDPPPTVFPISAAQMADWKNQANAAGTYGGINGCVSTLNAGKYIGDVNFNSGCNIIANSPIWITGNLIFSNTNTIRLNTSYGTNSGIIIVDGQIDIGNNNSVVGTGSGSSQLILLSTYNSQSSGLNAVTIKNGGNNIVLYADSGIINVANGNALQQITGWEIVLNNGVNLVYNSGFASQFFQSGPSGTYSLVQGTYQLK